MITHKPSAMGPELREDVGDQKDTSVGFSLVRFFFGSYVEHFFGEGTVESFFLSQDRFTRWQSSRRGSLADRTQASRPGQFNSSRGWADRPSLK